MSRPSVVLVPSLATGTCASVPPASSSSDADLVVRGATVVDVVAGRTIANRDVLLKGDRIVDVVPSG